MADSHLRLLRAFTRNSQRKLEDLDAADTGDGSEGRRNDLERTAFRSRAQLAAAEARRRRAPDA